LLDYHDKVRALLAVDDFAPGELGRPTCQEAPLQDVPQETAALEKATKKKVQRKKASKKARKKTN
jgi:hypothetical protein